MPVKLSSPITSMYVHKLRAEHQAILVGRKTALLDNPSLTVRDWYGKNPLRMVIDRDLSLPPSLRLFDGSTPTWVFTSKEAPAFRWKHAYVGIHFQRKGIPAQPDLHPAGLRARHPSANRPDIVRKQGAIALGRRWKHASPVLHRPGNVG